MAFKKKSKKVEEEIDEVSVNNVDEVVEESEEVTEEAPVEEASFKASDFSTLSVPVSDQWMEYNTPQFQGQTGQQIRGILLDEGII